MGRTNPTYRQCVQQFKQDWQPFRRALYRQDQPVFDRLLEHADTFANAGFYQNGQDPRWAILMSMLLWHERKLIEIETRLTNEAADPNPPS